MIKNNEDLNKEKRFSNLIRKSTNLHDALKQSLTLNRKSSVRIDEF